jgi:ubiquinone/menaquinone biosynthesis methyltransferase
MLRLARGKIGPHGPAVLADALDLPFFDNSFDVVFCAFGLRNLADLEKGLRSIHRVLRPGGEAAILEFTREDRDFPHKGFREIMLRTVTWIARYFSPDPAAYRYLSGSIREFYSADELADAFKKVGFTGVSVKLLTLGLCTLLTASKPQV